MKSAEIIYALAALASGVAAILAWAAKIRWSKEYTDAKEAQIKVLEREIQTLKDFTPMKIQEYFASVKKQLEDYNNDLLKQLDAADVEISEKNKQISALQKQGNVGDTKLQILVDEEKELAEKIQKLKAELQTLQQAYLPSLAAKYSSPVVDALFGIIRPPTLSELANPHKKDPTQK